MITVATLIQCGAAPTQARIYAAPLAAAADRFGITTKARVAAFLAQVYVESDKFTRTEENLFYTTPQRIRDMWPTRVATLADAANLIRNPKALAAAVYSNRLGNGDASTGEGWKYRGRGLIQLTGRTNYHVASDSLQADYVRSPDVVAEPDAACMTAAWFWSSVHGNDLADSSQIDLLTKRINGPQMAAATERRSRYTDNLRALA